MKNPAKTYMILFLLTLVVLVPAGVYLGYRMGTAASCSTHALIAINKADFKQVQAAMTEFQNDSTIPCHIKAFDIDTSEFNVMQWILANTGCNTGFRVYLGKEPGGSSYERFYAGLKDGHPDGTVYYSVIKRTPALCPPICDPSDPLLNH